MDTESHGDHHEHITRSAPPPSGTLNRANDSEDSLSIRASRTGEFMVQQDRTAILKWAAVGIFGLAGVLLVLGGLTFAAQKLLIPPKAEPVVAEPVAEDAERTVDGIKVRKGLRQ